MREILDKETPEIIQTLCQLNTDYHRPSSTLTILRGFNK